MSFLILIRHAESVKNVERRQGGSGAALTAHGEAQCEALVRFLEHEGLLKEVCVVTHRRPQTLATAECITGESSLPLCLDERLRGISLGVLEGLPEDDARHLHPESAWRLSLWNKGKLCITRLNIPGAEDAFSFRNRVLEGYRDTVLPLFRLGNTICVLTRSVLILLYHVLTLGPEFSFQEYRPLRFRNASLTMFSGLPTAPHLEYYDQTVCADKGDRV